MLDGGDCKYDEDDRIGCRRTTTGRGFSRGFQPLLPRENAHSAQQALTRAQCPTWTRAAVSLFAGPAMLSYAKLLNLDSRERELCQNSIECNFVETSCAILLKTFASNPIRDKQNQTPLFFFSKEEEAFFKTVEEAPVRGLDY